MSTNDVDVSYSEDFCSDPRIFCQIETFVFDGFISSCHCRPFCASILPSLSLRFVSHLVSYETYFKLEKRLDSILSLCLVFFFFQALSG